MSNILETFTEIRNDPYDWARKWKAENNKKVIGVGPMHFPEELVHASGALPFVLQEGSEAVVDGYAYIYPAYCGLTRNIVDMAARGHLDFLDGILLTDICIQMAETYSILWRNFRRGYMALNQPTVDLRAQRALKDITEEFEKIRTGLSNEIAGFPIEDKTIVNSIEVYNRNRSLLRAIYEMRQKQPGLLKARDIQAIVMSAMVMPKEESNIALAKLLKELEMMPSVRIDSTPLFLSGHFCQAPKLELLDIIESLGGVVIDDDLFTGYRYFAKDAAMDNEPIRSLVRRYLEIEPPCPTRFHPNNMWDRYILDRASAAGAKGIIILQPKFCEPQMFGYVHQKKTLTEAGMPHILIETEHEMLSFEGIRTRIQAFLEMIEGNRR